MTLQVYNKKALPKMFLQAPKESLAHICLKNSNNYVLASTLVFVQFLFTLFWDFTLKSMCGVFFTLGCLFHFGPSWCGAQLRTNGNQGDWGTVGSLGPLTVVAENQSLMHPFLLSKGFFLSHCFLVRSRQKMREPGKGLLEGGHICVKRKDLG